MCQKALVLWDTGSRKHLSCSGNTACHGDHPALRGLNKRENFWFSYSKSSKQVLLQVRFDPADERLSRRVLNCHALSPALSTALSPPFTNVSASGITSLASAHGHRLLGTVCVRPGCRVWVRPTQMPRVSTEERPSREDTWALPGEHMPAPTSARAAESSSSGVPAPLLLSPSFTQTSAEVRL